MKIERTLLYCRFSRRYLGFREFQECVRIALEDEERLLYVGAIYQEVGEKFGVSRENRPEYEEDRVIIIE